MWWTTSATDAFLRPFPALSDDGAPTRDGPADDQRVHLSGALVGVDGLGVGDVPADVVLEQDAVAAHQLAGPADGLPHPHGAERLGQRRLLVGHPPFVLQLREPRAQGR